MTNFYRRAAPGDHTCEAFTAADAPCGAPAVEQLVFFGGQGELYVCSEHLAEHTLFGGHTCEECERLR